VNETGSGDELFLLGKGASPDYIQNYFIRY